MWSNKRDGRRREAKLTQRLQQTHRRPEEDFERADTELEQNEEDTGAHEGEESGEPDGNDVLPEGLSKLRPGYAPIRVAAGQSWR